MLIHGRFDVVLLQKCLNAIIESDTSLRTRIAMVNGQPFQYYADFVPEQFPVFDFSQTSKEGVAYWEEAVTREIMPVLDHPLYRFSIFRLGEQEGGVLLKTHHIITDGWSQVCLLYTSDPWNWNFFGAKALMASCQMELMASCQME